MQEEDKGDTVKLFDFRTGECMHTIKDNDRAVVALTFSNVRVDDLTIGSSAATCPKSACLYFSGWRPHRDRLG